MLSKVNRKGIKNLVHNKKKEQDVIPYSVNKYTKNKINSFIFIEYTNRKR